MYTTGQYKNKLESSLTLLYIEFCSRSLSMYYKSELDDTFYVRCVHNFICELSHSNEYIWNSKTARQVIETVMEKQNNIIRLFAKNGQYEIDAIERQCSDFWLEINEIVESYFQEQNED